MLPDRARSSYTRALASQFGPGQTVALRRLAGAGAGDYSVSAWVIDIAPSDVVGAVQQLKRKAIVLASDVEAAAFPTPFLAKQDRLIWQGKTLVIMAVNDGSRRVQGVLLAYELEISGA